MLNYEGLIYYFYIIYYSISKTFKYLMINDNINGWWCA
jgi:hypothetical protein